MDYLEITIQTASAGIKALGAWLTGQGFDSFVLDDQAEYEDFLEHNRAYWDYIDEGLEQKLQGLSQIKLYVECDGTQDKKLARLRAGLQKLPGQMPQVDFGSLALTAAPMADQDWENSWKENYPPQEVGKSLIVLPYWLADGDASGRIPVILDPGLTFGTGAHPSTQMCMEAMEERVKPGWRVVDLGSGSGILSITALRLGAAQAVGVDIDPKAEDIARENAGYNGFAAPRFRACTGNVSQSRGLMAELEREPFDLVLVNIVADVILSLAPVLPRLMGPGAVAVCSGILDTRLAEVTAALEAQGLRILETRAREVWRCVVAAR